MTSGFLLIDKDRGWTSHDVVAKVRGLLDRPKVGHAGTLDPMATGLLVLGVGRATRLLRFVQDLSKEYQATAVFGIGTDTLDADGEVVEQNPLPVDAAAVQQALAGFTGTIMQVPPMVSALKVQGRKLYELAREGAVVEREARPVVVHQLDLTGFVPGDYPTVSLTVRCSKGTYVRSLVDDIAGSLGGRAHLTALRRTRIGSLDVSAAHTVETVAPGLLMSADAALRDLPGVTVTADVGEMVRHGRPLEQARIVPTGAVEGPFRVTGPGDELLAVYRLDGLMAVAEVVVAGDQVA